MLHLDESTHLYEKILEMAPQAVDKIQQMFSKKNEQQGSGTQGSHQSKQNETPKQEFDI